MGLAIEKLQLWNPVRPELEAVEIGTLADNGGGSYAYPAARQDSVTARREGCQGGHLAAGSRRLVPYIDPLELRYRTRVGFTDALVMGGEPFWE